VADMDGPLEVALQLAASEASAAGYGEITSAHLLVALARLSEPGLAPRVNATTLQGEFEQLGIDPRRFRRRLRALLGNGGEPPGIGGMHRSQECRAVFAAAQAIATQQAVPLGLEHLLHAVLISLVWCSAARESTETEVKCLSCGRRAAGVRVGEALRCSACGAEVGTRNDSGPRADDEIPAEL
jgi:hypothetical protein